MEEGGCGLIVAAPRICSGGPGAALSSAYFDARFKILREPLGFAPSAAKLPDDEDAIHAWIEIGEPPISDAESVDNLGDVDAKKMGGGGAAVTVVAVGRIHQIPADSTGACADTADPNTAHCPDFPPLGNHGLSDAGGVDFPAPEKLRPAVQIRQMGTLDNHQRKGYAASILNALEQAAIQQWGECTGFLQARVAAIAFYQTQNWTCFGDEYMVEGIGIHRSMWKPLNGQSNSISHEKYPSKGGV